MIGIPLQKALSFQISANPFGDVRHERQQLCPCGHLLILSTTEQGYYLVDCHLKVLPNPTQRQAKVACILVSHKSRRF